MQRGTQFQINSNYTTDEIVGFVHHFFQRSLSFIKQSEHIFTDNLARQQDQIQLVKNALENISNAHAWVKLIKFIAQPQDNNSKLFSAIEEKHSQIAAQYERLLAEDCAFKLLHVARRLSEADAVIGKYDQAITFSMQTRLYELMILALYEQGIFIQKLIDQHESFSLDRVAFLFNKSVEGFTLAVPMLLGSMDKDFVKIYSVCMHNSLFKTVDQLRKFCDLLSNEEDTELKRNSLKGALQLLNLIRELKLSDRSESMFVEKLMKEIENKIKFVNIVPYIDGFLPLNGNFSLKPIHNQKTRKIEGFAVDETVNEKNKIPATSLPLLKAQSVFLFKPKPLNVKNLEMVEDSLSRLETQIMMKDSYSSSRKNP